MTSPSQSTPDARTFGYTVDARDRITSVTQAFEDFAQENAAPELPGRVVGSCLWDHIADGASRHLYRLLFTRVRSTGRTTRVPIRCDTPSLRRDMELEIRAGRDGGLVVTSRVTRQQARAAIPLLDTLQPRSRHQVRMCSWCKAVHVGGTWHALEDALALSSILRRIPVPSVTHGICEPCMARVEAELHDRRHADVRAELPRSLETA